MTFFNTRLLLNLAAAALLSGCNGASTGGGTGSTVFSIPTDPPPAYVPPISESYVIQRAPEVVVVQPPLAPRYSPPAAPEYSPPVVQGTTYDLTEVFEVIAAENAQRRAEAERLALADLIAQAEARAIPQNEGGYAPFEVTPPGATFDAMAEAEARAAAAEAEATALALELAKARAAVAEAEAAAIAAESEAQRAVRERVAQLSAERNSAPRTVSAAPPRPAPVTAPPITSPRVAALPVDATPDRANPRLPARPVLGRFATRPAPPPRARPAAPTPPPQQVAALTSPAAPRISAPPPPPRPIVERAPIPGLKPYILARSALPSAKPRRAPPTRSFGIGNAATLGAPGSASITPPDITIPREPGADLSAQFFPTPGKPSTLGTDLDTSLDLASIDATPYGVGQQVAVTVEGDTAEWTDAVSLIENGEVEALSITEDSDLVLTLCSGRSILTTPPDLASAATLTAPQIICGQNKPLELR